MSLTPASAPPPNDCPDHPSHASLSHLWCRVCGVFKLEGVYYVNEGRESLLKTLGCIGAPHVPRDLADPNTLDAAWSSKKS